MYDDTVAEGVVIDQSIASGTEVAEGATITLTVSRGPEPEPDPTPSPEPSVEPSEEPESSAQPSAPAETESRTLNIPLPNDGREGVQVRVEVNGVEQFDRWVETSLLMVMPTIEYVPPAQVRVYIDGELFSEETY